jgi:hypothetical protein
MPTMKLNSTKRNFVRLMLVTGSTLATIVGAQSLAALDTSPSSTSRAAAQTDSNIQAQAPNSLQSLFGLPDNSGVTLEQVSPGVYMLVPSNQAPSSSSSSSISGQTTTSRPRIHSRSSR